MGTLLAIARAARKRQPLVETDAATVGISDGIQGDVRGKTPGRQITILFREGWDQACEDLGVKLPWTTRRANLLIEGMPVPRQGARLQIGECILEVTQETKPCQVMEAAHRGLKQALTPDWRGGVCCRVVSGGAIRAGQPVDVL
jgi:MOSC domain-containing protein YiiM